MASITRRGVQLWLSAFWLLDGLLQLQPRMFTRSFANDVIAPVAQGQPVVVGGLMRLSSHLFLLQPAVFNSLVVIIQLVLGVLILRKPSVRLGLILSVVWGLFVWYIGEGLGGLLSGQTSILMGAPGAALLYVILALAVIPPKPAKKAVRGDQRPAYWLPIIWAVLWVGGAIYQLLPGQNSVSSVSAMVAGNATGAPDWLASLDGHVARAINGLGTPTTSMAGMHMTATQMAQMQTQAGSGYWFILVVAAVQAAIGLAIFLPNLGRKLAVGAGIVVSIVFWVVGQSLGGYYTGLATDPNAAPLFILLGVAILGCARLGYKELISKAEGDLSGLLV